MASSDERRNMGMTKDLFGEHLYDNYSEMEESSISPNGPLSDLNLGSNGSCYSSPVDSELGSTETETVEGVSLAELTRRMAEYTFNVDDDDDEKEGDRALSQSNKATTVSDVEKSEMGNENHPRKGKRLKGKEKRLYGHGKRGILSAQSGSGMRAVFLGGSNNRSGSSGTGVFLPNATSITQKPKKKTDCSSVLVPTRVLNTLQQHFTNVSAQSTSNNNQPWENDILERINGLLSHQNEEQTKIETNVTSTNEELEELRLPQEWTY